LFRLGEENNFLDITDLYCCNIANIIQQWAGQLLKTTQCQVFITS